MATVTHRVGRWCAYAAAALALAYAAPGVVRAVDDFDTTADRNSGFDYADREIAWGNGWTLSQDALYAARSLIPSSEAYQVSVGPAERFDEALTPTFVASYLRSFLIPRHQRENADWIVCYRCDAPAGVEATWSDDAEGISILRRRSR